MIVIILFWISLSVLFYCYIGYGLLLFGFNALKKLVSRAKIRAPAPAILPVTMIIAAYNEGPFLEQKLENTLAIDYPDGALEIIFVTDGSTDGSEKIINHPSVIALHQEKREGKLAAITRAMQYVKSPVVVFSDANTMLNRECIKRIIMHYMHPGVGGVAGEKKIIRNSKTSVIGEAEGLYWQYESFMKKQDADFNTVVGAAGELFSMRSRLFAQLPGNLVLDDFVLSMKICLQGYKIKYEPGAFATESPSVSLEEEAKRKIRISAGAWQSIGYLKECLNFFKYPLLCFQYLSRRLLRWVVCPWMLALVFFTNIMLAGQHGLPGFYTWFLYGQLFFYGGALAGGLLLRSGRYIGILAVPFYFLFMNYCLVKGFFKFLRGTQTVLWEKSVRHVNA